MSAIETKTITSMTTLAEVPANGDLLALDDISATATKSIAVGYVRRFDYDLVIVTGSLTPNAMQYIELSGASAIALTISGAPTVGDVIEIFRVGTGGVTHTVVLSGSVTWDGTNETANFADDNDYLRAIAISATRWRVLTNSTVTFS